MSDHTPPGASERGEDDLPDPRPQPRYGVYATPEEQRARIQKPDAPGALENGESVADPRVVTGPVPTTGSISTVASTGEPGRARTMDRIVTLALLVYALLNVTVAALGLLDFREYASTVYQVIGIPGEFANIDQGRIWGTAAAIALVVGYLLTAWFSVRRVLSGRLAWWVPLLGAVVTHLVAGVLVVIPLLSDPSFSAYLTSLR